MKLTLSTQADVEFVEDHEKSGTALGKLYDRRAHHVSTVADLDAKISILEARVRRGLVRYKPSLDGSLPVSFGDFRMPKVVEVGAQLLIGQGATDHRDNG